MGSLILKTSSRFLLIIFAMFSLFLLLRGHQQPGGGFTGGLLLGGGFALHGLAHGRRAIEELLGLDPKAIVGCGLLAALASGVPAALGGRPFLTGTWSAWSLPGVGKIGSVLLFDLGVYLVVFGTILLVYLSLSEE